MQSRGEALKSDEVHNTTNQMSISFSHKSSHNRVPT